MTARTETVRLRRGVLVQPATQGLLQVGSDPGRRVLLPDSPAMTGYLRDLSSGTGRPASPELAAALARLEDAGLVVDEAELARRRVARERTRARLLGPEGWCRQLAEHVCAAGLQVDGVPSDEEGGVGEEHGPADDVIVLVSEGEPARDEVDRLTHGGGPVLLVASVDARVRLGPFVLPGVTACLRCLDVHLAAGDARRAFAPPFALPGGPPEVSPVLLSLASVRAAADLVAWAEGRRPVTWSATTWTDEELVDEHRAWPRHPHCGCSWSGAMLYG